MILLNTSIGLGSIDEINFNNMTLSASYRNNRLLLNKLEFYTPIGNIKNNSITEIWNGDKMNLIREGFINNNPNKVCKLCIESQKVNI